MKSAMTTERQKWSTTDTEEREKSPVQLRDVSPQLVLMLVLLITLTIEELKAIMLLIFMAPQFT